ncbi:hypothetical protein SRHO_G00283110 [Serrasalmus rhombeus]
MVTVGGSCDLLTGRHLADGEEEPSRPCALTGAAGVKRGEVPSSQNRVRRVTDTARSPGLTSASGSSCPGQVGLAGPFCDCCLTPALQMLSSVRSSSLAFALSRQLSHFRPSMEPGAHRPVEMSIRTKLTQTLQPEHLEVLNESHMHAVPPGSESHFRVLVVSPRFEGLSLLQRHRLVNEALREELSSSVHALAIQAKTPQQWSSDPSLAKSPPCLGGSKHDHTVAEKLKAGSN